MNMRKVISNMYTVLLSLLVQEHWLELNSLYTTHIHIVSMGTENSCYMVSIGNKYQYLYTSEAPRTFPWSAKLKKHNIYSIAICPSSDLWLSSITPSENCPLVVNFVSFILRLSWNTQEQRLNDWLSSPTCTFYAHLNAGHKINSDDVSMITLSVT